MITRKAHAKWEGELKVGSGHLRLGSGAYEGKYSFGTRFEGAPGTNPEELLGAAHAGCFSMALNLGISQAGFAAEYVDSSAEVQMDKVGGGMAIVNIKLTTKAKVPGLSKEKFAELAEATKVNCIISKALSVPMTLEATLEG
ncbi:MAG TPA: OsmC family protein [Gemmatimonadaceae bacterium]|nr:OsmC family protein [Gemmatimonadaceae bacterium]HRQ78503.1 OsmC family protein [Gemmatimonadaceae bacterium]